MSIVYRTVYYLLRLISYVFLARVILSWIPALRQNRIYEFIHQVTEPILKPIRNLLSRTKAATWPIDVSIIIVFLLIGLLQTLIYGLAF